MLWADALTVNLSRIQFAVTALYHFLFVPLTLGLSWVLVIMEAAYLKTGKQIYKDMCRFWGKLFAINFAMGVVTGITLEFEFGQNWAYFSRFIGDTFGAALAIEGITAFMTEATMFGLYFFTWDKVSKKVHFLITVVMAAGTNLSIVNILVANSWMQNPVSSYFDVHSMSMHLTSFAGIYLHQLAQIRVGHVAFAGFTTASMFVLGVSAYHLLKRRDMGFALRSISVAAGFGLASLIFVFFMGDANGIAIAQKEPAKMAAVEGQWHTQKPPAAWYPIAFPSQSEERNKRLFIKIPYALSLIATHSLTGTVEGLIPIMQKNKTKLINGAKAYEAMIAIRQGKATPQQETIFKHYRHEIGFGQILAHYAKDPLNPTQHELNLAMRDTIPEVWVPFWTFRIMLGCWGLMFLVCLCIFIFCARRTIARHRFLLRCATFCIPLPYIAAESGWILAEMGRQPWVVHGYLPTFDGVSSLAPHVVGFSLAGFVLFYSLLFMVMVFLMFKVARHGPSVLGEGRYHFETLAASVKE